MRNHSSNFEALPKAAPDVLALVRDFELRHRVWLTLHDIVGALALPDGTNILPSELLGHRHPRCRHGREAKDGAVEAACLAHCWRAAHAFGARTQAPFTHRCWRGQRELVVPVFDDNILCVMLFLMPQQSPWPRPNRLAAMAHEAEALVRHLIRQAEQLQGIGDSSDRKRVLRRLLAFHSHQPVGRDTVAKTLGVSASRATHIVRELFGKPWRELLVDARVERAKRLLRQPQLKVA